MTQYYFLAALLIGLSTLTAWASLNDPVERLSYEFDEDMLSGVALPKGGLARFSQGVAAQPGRYLVDLFLNQTFLTRRQIDFVASADGEIDACLSPTLLHDAGVNLPAPSLPEAADATPLCQTIGQLRPGASVNFDFARLRLNIVVPQALLRSTPRGAVPVAELDAGVSMGFANYDLNYYRTSGNHQSTDHSLYASLNYGFNAGLWQLRQQAGFSRSGADHGTAQWHTQRTYVQRALPQWQSQLLLGDAYTAGGLFGSIGFRGMQLSTDERMRPDALRGYAPTVRGTAATMARVTVLQAGKQIYQATVPPGAFVLDDLYPTSYEGDLDVEVTEADGSTTSFKVPFNALPESMRPGQYRTELAVGQVNAETTTPFAEFTWQGGINNAVTANAGLRVAKAYQAGLVGGVFASSAGALGLNAVYSNATLAADQNAQGWQLAANWSRTFAPTATTFAVAAYRYSTDGYRSLQDTLGQRGAVPGQTLWRSDSWQQRTQLNASLAQSLGGLGQLHASYNTSQYRNGRARDTQYQVSYSHSLYGVSYNLTLARQRSGSVLSGLQPVQGPGQSASSQNTLLLSISAPLGSGAVVAAGMTLHSGQDRSYQTSLSGTAGEQQGFSYALTAEQDQPFQQDRSTSASLSVQQQLPYAALSGSASAGGSYNQVGAGMRGALVLHTGGVTLGPYLGETFALIEAKGATGATLRNATGAQIDSFGYALLPNLQPYRYNNVLLEPARNQRTAELIDSQQRVAPYAGAAVHLRFQTRHGYAMLIRAQQPDGESLPLGANVYSARHALVGLVGQGSQIYVRTEHLQDELHISWGDAPGQSCRVHYQLDAQAAQAELIRFSATCKAPAITGIAL